MHDMMAKTPLDKPPCSHLVLWEGHCSENQCDLTVQKTLELPIFTLYPSFPDIEIGFYLQLTLFAPHDQLISEEMFDALELKGESDKFITVLALNVSGTKNTRTYNASPGFQANDRSYLRVLEVHFPDRPILEPDNGNAMLPIPPNTMTGECPT